MQSRFFTSTRNYLALLAVMLLLLFSDQLFAQTKPNWEIGLCIRPVAMKTNPYAIVVKKFISRGVALRLGLGGLVDHDNNHIHHVINYFLEEDENLRFAYEYDQIDKKLYLDNFTGIQYGKRKNYVYFYGASDLVLGYERYNREVPSAQVLDGRIRPGDVFIFGEHFNSSSFNIGFAQNFGAQFFINRNLSLSVETGMLYVRKQTKRQEFGYAAAGSRDPLWSNPSISYRGAIRRAPESSLKANLLSLFALNYHF